MTLEENQTKFVRFCLEDLNLYCIQTKRFRAFLKYFVSMRLSVCKSKNPGLMADQKGPNDWTNMF